MMLQAAMGLHPVGTATPDQVYRDTVFITDSGTGVACYVFDQHHGFTREHWFPSIVAAQLYAAERLAIAHHDWFDLWHLFPLDDRPNRRREQLWYLCHILRDTQTFRGFPSSFTLNYILQAGYPPAEVKQVTSDLCAIMQAQRPLEVRHQTALPYVLHLLHAQFDQRIPPIKLYRRITWLGLKESKEAVEAVQAAMRAGELA